MVTVMLKPKTYEATLRALGELNSHPRERPPETPAGTVTKALKCNG